MMETVTRKKPTNEMFEGETSLRSWVEESISSSLNQVLDINLQSSIGRKRSATDNCALSILQVGLECSVEAPDERLDMKESVTKLKEDQSEVIKGYWTG